MFYYISNVVPLWEIQLEKEGKYNLIALYNVVSGRTYQERKWNTKCNFTLC